MNYYLLTLLTFVIGAATIQAQDKKEHTHDEHLSTLVAEYMEFKNALVTDDFEKAQKHVSKFAEEVQSSNEMNEHNEHQEMHQRHHSKMVNAVDEASKATNIDELRASLEGITVELVKAVENQGYDRDKLYLQFCPMVNDGKGSNWLSKSEKIANPYYGTKMHKCGATVKTIN
jgi:Cu(I)/Ag(I) efflux system membrane fusion protein